MINPPMPCVQMSVNADLIQAAIAFVDATKQYEPEAFPAAVIPALRELRNAVAAYRQQKFFRDYPLNVSAPRLAEIRLRELLAIHLRAVELGNLLAQDEPMRLCRKGDK